MADVYALLGGALGALSTATEPASIVPRFELRLLSVLGYAPAGGACVRCDTPLGGVSAWADLEAGGLVCERCRPYGADALGLEPADVANFQALGAERGGATRAALEATPAVARVVDAFVSYHLGKRPKSKRLLEELSHP